MDFVDFGSYCSHLSMMACASKNHNLSLVTVRNTKVAQARNAIVEKVRQMTGDFVCFLDTDHLVPKDMVDCLLQNREMAGVISGLVCRRRGPKDPIGYVQRDDGQFYAARLERNTGSRFVDTCAFGCTLIRKELLCGMPDPVFYDSIVERDGRRVQMRSDLNFCLDVRKRKEQIIVDTRVVVGHVGEPEVIWPPEDTSGDEESSTGDGLHPGQPKETVDSI